MVASSTEDFIRLVAEIGPKNSTEFCINYLNNSLNAEESVIRNPPPQWQVWTLGLLMVSIISFSAALGILLMPFLKPSVYDRVLTYFVGLGIGTLSASAIFGLIPEAYDLHLYIPSYLDKAVVVIGGIYLFYVVDKIINISVRWKEARYHAEGSAVSPDLAKDEKTNATAVTEPSPENERIRRNSIVSCKAVRHVASVAWLVIFGDGLHNFIDGLSIGAAFNENILSGLSVSIAILCEELPHELGDCAILVSSGLSLREALIYNLLSASTCYLGFFIGVVVGQISHLFGQMIFALAGGMFLYISLCGMLSKINQEIEDLLKIDIKKTMSTMLLQSAGIASGLLIIFLFSKYGSLIEIA
ncbi:unnamed protein product [Dracunculus medinensis]|uniref:Zinc transporter ZIP8 n=1 Tax=Dracunculus medinensis TaxID=318479 RepID=A0A0N4UHX6_DRAME|nr:unnamed protein product [Dracunculus medinensis]